MTGAGHNNATALLARCLTGISATDFSNPDPADVPSVAGDFEDAGEHAIAMLLVTPSGDRYRLTVEWLGDRESL